MRRARVGRIALAIATGCSVVALAGAPPAVAEDPPMWNITQDTTVDTTTGEMVQGGQSMGTVGTLQPSPNPAFPQWRVLSLTSLTIAPSATLRFDGNAIPVLD